MVEMHVHVQSVVVVMTLSQKWGLDFVLNTLKHQRMDLRSSQQKTRRKMVSLVLTTIVLPFPV
jgi:hypothetical protein